MAEASVDQVRPKRRSRGWVSAQNAPVLAPTGAQLDSGFGYQGGPIIQSPDVHVCFWGASWAQTANAQTRANLVQFVEDFLASNYMNILSQYSVGQGAGKCGVFRGDSNHTAVNGDLSDNDIHNNIQTLINNGTLPEPGSPSSIALVIFMDTNVRVNDSGEGIVMCERNGDTAFGFHNFFTTRAGHRFYYAVIPALDDTCLKSSCSVDSSCSLHLSAAQEQRRTQVASHEFSEMVTDPEITAWRDPNNGNENGDDCNGTNGTITVSGRTWTVQQMYSRVDDVAGRAACILVPANPIPPIGVPTGPQPTGDSLQPGQVLEPGQSISSADGRYLFIYQTDGNLVLYQGGTALWATGTNGRGFGAVIMQPDGNLVLYIGGPFAVWSSGTNGHPGSHLVVQNDGNVVIYGTAGNALWATNTWIPTGPQAHGSEMQPGEVLNPGQSIGSPDGHYTFIYQTDGNLVLYRSNLALWASGTNGRGLGVCIMQTDGNLVIYTRGGHALWASSTNGHPGSSLVVQNDGNVVIYSAGNALWATNTWIPTGPQAHGSEMQPGEVLNPGQSISSADLQYLFIYQNDGNLVLYRAGAALWASGTNGRGLGVCIMQTDGNLVIYTPGGHAIWASSTNGHPGSSLVVQNDGNVVIYSAGNALWATNTWIPTGPQAHGSEMQPGEVLNPGQSISSADLQYLFIYQNDGNLVLYRQGAARWASGTNGRGLGVCFMQQDGNLVVYGRGGHALWASGTNGSNGSHLIAQDDGNVVIYRPDGHAIWATNTVG